jgi:hypothetical protein
VPRCFAEQRTHRILQVGELAEHAAEDLPQRIGDAFRRRLVDLSTHAFQRPVEHGLDGAHGVAEDRVHVVVAHAGPAG